MWEKQSNESDTPHPFYHTYYTLSMCVCMCVRIEDSAAPSALFNKTMTLNPCTHPEYE